MAQTVVRLVGMEQRSYTGKDGLPKMYCGLQLVYPEGMVKDVQGSKVESASCPQGLDPRILRLGQLYALEYELYQTKTGKGARLVDLLPVDEPEGKK